MGSNSIRTWLKVNWIYPVLVGYVLISLAYQSWGNLMGSPSYQPVQKIILSPCYYFKFRIPEKIPLAAVPAKDQARPITVWGWKDANPICALYSDEVSVNFTDDDTVIFTDNQQIETHSNVNLKLGTNEANAIRQTLYIYVPFTGDKIEQATLHVNILGQTKDLPSLDVQTAFISGMLRFLNFIFGIPLVTVVAAVAGIVKFYFDQQERRQQRIRGLEEKFEQLRNAPKEHIGTEGMKLYQEAKFLGDIFIEKLRSIIDSLKDQYGTGNVWNYSLRLEIFTRAMKKDDKFSSWIELVSEEFGFPVKKDIEVLQWFSQWMQEDGQQREVDGESLQKFLRVFQIVGMSGRDPITQKMGDLIGNKRGEQKKKIVSLLTKQWYEKGKGAGHYLLRFLEDQDIQGELKTLQKDRPTPPNRLTQHFWPWPNKIRFQLPSRGTVGYPFGPLKAEDDPRLPLAEFPDVSSVWVSGMFWDEHPLWIDSISQPQSSTYFTESGMGTTAFMWMGRRERRFWGIKPSLSLYLELSGSASEKKVWQGLEASLAEIILISLVEDPYWLLDAASVAQGRIGAFLISRYGETTRLLRSLEELGLPPHEQMLIADMLIGIEAAAPYRQNEFSWLLEKTVGCMADAAVDRLYQHEAFKCFLWVEIKNSPAITNWLDLLDILGIGSIGVLKMFCIGKEKPEAKVTELVPISWDKDKLGALLEHRIGQKWKNEGWLNFAGNVDKEKLLDQAGNSPRELMRLGNEAVFGKQSK